MRNCKNSRAWRVRPVHLLAAMSGVVLAGVASAQHSMAEKEVVTPDGVFTVPVGSPHGPVPGGPMTRSGGWFHDVSPGIGNAIAFTEEHTWGAVQLNNERLSIFRTDGDGTPVAEVMSNDRSPSGIAATPTGTRAVYLDNTPDELFRISVYDTRDFETPVWQHVFASEFGNAAFVNMKRNVTISRDGTVVGALMRNAIREVTVAHFFDGETGDLISTYEEDDPGASIRLTDDGSRAMVSLWNRPRVIDTATGDLIWSGTGSGAGNVDYRISGDGNIISVGGFSLHVYEWNGSTYQQIMTFSGSPTQWFGFGTALSSDGSTIGSIARAHSTEDVYVRTWDVPSRSLIDEVVLTAVPGTYQTSPQHAEATDDGSRFVFATWADGTGVYPEITVYDRDVKRIAEIHMPGSGYHAAIAPDGSWFAGTGKAVHANVFGNGGQFVAEELETDAPCIADWNGDGEVDINDFFAYLSDFEAGDPRADLNNDGEIDINDFFIFLQEFEIGC